jgi:hypothetical protein
LNCLLLPYLKRISSIASMCWLGYLPLLISFVRVSVVLPSNISKSLLAVLWHCFAVKFCCCYSLINHETKQLISNSWEIWIIDIYFLFNYFILIEIYFSNYIPWKCIMMPAACYEHDISAMYYCSFIIGAVS